MTRKRGIYRNRHTGIALYHDPERKTPPLLSTVEEWAGGPAELPTTATIMLYYRMPLPGDDDCLDYILVSPSVFEASWELVEEKP